MHPARFCRPLEYLRTLRGVKNARLTHSQKYLELRFLKIIRTPHFFVVLSSTLVHFGTLKTHGCTHSQKYLAKVSKDNTHPARFYRSLEYPCTLRNAKNARLHAFSEIFKQRFLKITRTPHAFIVLSSTL